jgi:excisionase family DNA binding protein
MELEKLIDAQPVKDALGVSEKRVYELVRTGLLPAVKLGRQLRFRPSQVQAFIEAGGAALPGGWRKEVR